MLNSETVLVTEAKNIGDRERIPLVFVSSYGIYLLQDEEIADLSVHPS